MWLIFSPRSPPGLYLGGMLCMYHAWLFHIRPLVATSTTVGIILMSFLVLRLYLKTWLADPGFVASPQEGRAATVIRTVEDKGGLPQVSKSSPSMRNGNIKFRTHSAQPAWCRSLNVPNTALCATGFQKAFPSSCIRSKLPGVSPSLTTTVLSRETALVRGTIGPSSHGFFSSLPS